MQKKKLRAYANLIAKMGVNIQKGQDVVINAELDQPEFIAILVDECYKCGARRVDVQWSYQPLTKIHVRHMSLKALSSLENWELERLEHRANTLPAMIHIISDDPDGLKGINQSKYSASAQKKRMIIKPYRDRMTNKYQWCIAAVPGVKWAKKLFPELTKKAAVEKLWEYILHASRADEDPIRQWEQHNKNVHDRCEFLNSLGLVSLHYTASNGTDFTVGLVPTARFLGAAEPTSSGVMYNANIPSEEVFTSPKKGEAEGVVYSSMPLSYQGELIDEFKLVFKEGRVVEYSAKQNEELLGKLLSMDDGASYLGECALVPYESPIRQTGVLFYNTLFDENAACHLALGDAYPEVLEDFNDLTMEQCKERGMNSSIIHEDFMIGTEDLSIIGKTADGKEIQIFKNGSWAIK